MILKYQDFITEKKNPCWKGYKQIGTKNKNGRKVPNCVKVNEQNYQEYFDRPSFYLEYYKNLSPSGFNLNLYGNQIVIDLPSI